MNETLWNATQPIKKTEMSDAIVGFLCFVYVLIFITGTVANAGVIYIIATKTKIIAYDLMIICLAISDLLASLFIPLQMIPDIISRLQTWYFGYLGCKILPIISPVMLFMSSWILVVIAADRYR